MSDLEKPIAPVICLDTFRKTRVIKYLEYGTPVDETTEQTTDGTGTL